MNRILYEYQKSTSFNKILIAIFIQIDYLGSKDSKLPRIKSLTIQIIDRFNENSTDQQICLEVNNKISQIYSSSLNLYPKSINLLGIFYVDILIFITNIILKRNELNRRLVFEKVIEPCHSYPYISYFELINFNPKIKSKTFKSNFITSQRQTTRTFKNIRNSFSFRNKKKILIYGQNHIFKEFLLRSCFQPFKIEIELEKPNHFHFGIPCLNSQLKVIESIFEDSFIAERIEPYTFNNMAYNIIERHILTFVTEANTREFSGWDAVICGSGFRTENRLISALSMHNQIPVFNVMHGETFGAIDEPIFEIGETEYCTHVLGFGSFFAKNSSSYRFLNKIEASYIPSRSKNLSLLTAKLSKTKKSTDIKFLYVPTQLRGNYVRYGPYGDMPDKTYLDWQKLLVSKFRGNIKVKYHKKCKYEYLFNEYHSDYLKGDLITYIQLSDVLVFDYLSTAFSQAATSNKPIIYIDTGVRSLHPETIKEIKLRCTYVTAGEFLDWDFMDIVNSVKRTFYSDYTKKFGGLDISLTQSDTLINSLKNL